MGNEAEDLQDDIAIADEEETTEVESDVDETEAGEEESDDSTGDGQAESESDEDSGDTQPDKTDVQSWLPGRLNKYKAKVAKVSDRAEKAEAELKLLREENTLKDLALEQAKAKQSQAPASIPNPDDFDGGVHDQAYIKAHGEYTQTLIKEQVGQQVAEATRQTTTAISQEAQQKELEKSQISHIQKAAKLKIKDYEVAEDRTIEILGLDNFNYLISNIDQSPELVNYLGKKANEAEAIQIAEVAKTNPAKAGILIGGVLAKLKPKPGKSKSIPEPDTELKGGTPTGGVAQSKYNKLVAKAQAGDNNALTKARELRKTMKAKGVILE